MGKSVGVKAIVYCDRWVWERAWKLTLEAFELHEFGELSEFVVREVKSLKLTISLRSEDA
jgi:hypothetical protein